jgi:hypothetical protein
LLALLGVRPKVHISGINVNVTVSIFHADIHGGNEEVDKTSKIAVNKTASKLTPTNMSSSFVPKAT